MKTNFPTFHRAVALLLLAVLVLPPFAAFSGCETIKEDSRQTFKTTDHEYVLAFILDMSGSFADRIHQDGDAYRFFMATADEFFRNRIGSEDRLILAQLSADDETLLFDGAPGAFRGKFRSSDEFRDYLTSKSDPSASRVHAAVGDTLNYVTGMHGIDPEKTNLLVVILSDMEDTQRDFTSDRRMERALANFAQFKHSSIGIYYCSQLYVGDWRDRLNSAGFAPGRSIVQAGIVDRPDLPNFD